MRAVVATAPGLASVQDVSEPEHRSNALVAVTRAGLCGTDLKVLAGAVPVTYPRILGHELIGTVVKAGMLGLPSEGSRVLVDPAFWCGHCHNCRIGRPNLCANATLMGRDVDGGFADLVAVEERRLHFLPESIADDEAVLLQVLGTCVHAQTLVEVFPGETAVVVGLGVSGLLHLQLLVARGIDRTIGVTGSAWKRPLASDLGAAEVSLAEEASGVVADMTGGRGADLVVEAVGSVKTLALAIDLAAFGGTILSFGVNTSTRGELPFYDLYFKELRVVNSRAALPGDYSRAVELVAARKLNLRPLLAKTYPLVEAPAALEACARDSSLLKVTLNIG